MSAPTFNDVARFHALFEAARRAARGKALSRDAAHFLLELEPQCLALERVLRARTYAPGPFRTFRIRDPKPRVISAAPFRDRVVHHALCRALEPTFEAVAHPHSYACRTGRGNHAAVRHAQACARRSAYFLTFDIRHFFETASHAVLLGQIATLVEDEGLRWLCEVFVRHTAHAAGRGLPIGNLTSQHFANLYLGPLDAFASRLPGVEGYVRSMDDLCLFGDRDALRAARAEVERFVPQVLQVELKAEVTRLEPVRHGLPFLGWRLWRGLRRFDAARKRRFCRKWRGLARLPVSEALDPAQSLVAWAAAGHTRGLRRALLARHSPAGRDDT